MTKEEKKDEMKNRISMALKDPILQQGFEIICKENAELKEELDAIDKAGEHVRQQINDAFRNKKPYWELEKENAELKEELKDANEKVVHLACNQNKDLKYKLTKATEILQEYIRINLLPPIERNFDDEVKLFRQAEQFLQNTNGL